MLSLFDRGKIDFAEFSSYTVEKIAALTSKESLAAYQADVANYDDLKRLEVPGIKSFIVNRMQFVEKLQL